MKGKVWEAYFYGKVKKVVRTRAGGADLGSGGSEKLAPWRKMHLCRNCQNERIR